SPPDAGAALHAAIHASVRPLMRQPPTAQPSPYTTLFRSGRQPSLPASPFSRTSTCPTLPPSVSLGTRTAQAKPRRAASTHALNRSEEHTSELQSREKLVCRLLPGKKKTSCAPRTPTA